MSYGAVQFFSYQQLQNLFKRIDSNQNGKFGINKTLQPFLSGAISGSAATIVTYPLDLLRTRFAAQGEKRVIVSLYFKREWIHRQNYSIDFIFFLKKNNNA